MGDQQIGRVLREVEELGLARTRWSCLSATMASSLESMQSGTNKPILRLHIVPPSCLECRELLLRSLTKWSNLWTSCPHWWRPQDSLRWTNVLSIPGTSPGAGKGQV